MKNIKRIYLLIIVAILTITSCTPEEETYEDLIIGTWQLTHIKGNSNIGCQNQTTFNFTSSNVELTAYDEDNIGNCYLDYQLTHPYSIINNVLTTGASSGVGTSDILQLDNNILELEQHISSNNDIIIKFARQ